MTGEGLGTDGLALLRFMPPDLREVVERSFVPRTFAFGDIVVAEGDTPDSVYVVVSGAARAVRATDRGEVTVASLGPGDMFGDAATLAGTASEETVRASARLELLRLDGALLRALAARIPDIRRYCDLHARAEALQAFFRLHSSFSNLPAAAMADLLTSLEEISVAAGETVVRQDDAAAGLHVVRDGHLRARRDGHDLGFYRAGDFFGEWTMLTGRAHAASVEAVSDAVLLRVSRSTVLRLMATYETFRGDVEAHLARVESATGPRVPLDFAAEILPAHAQPFEAVGPAQVEHHQPDDAPGGAAGPAPVAQPFAIDGRFVKSPRRLRGFPHLWQVDEADCGAACLAMVCRHFGRPVSLARVRQVVRTGIDGTSMQGITRGAQEVGLAARAVKASTRNLGAMPLPAVAHWDAQHWIVVYDVGPTHVRVADPALGRRRLPRSEFEERWSGYVVVFEATPAFREAPAEGRGWNWAPGLLHGYRRRLAVVAVLALLASGLEMLLPVFIQLVIDHVLPNRDVALLRSLLLTMAGVVVLALGATLAERYLLSRTTVQLDGRALDFLAEKLLALPMTYFYSRRTGDIQRRLAGVQQVRQLIVENGIQALTALAQLTAAVTIMFFYSWRLALVYLAAMPLYAVIVRLTVGRLRPILESLEEGFGKYYSHQIDAIKGIEAVKAMGAERTLGEQLRAEFALLSQRLFRGDFTTMCFEGGVQGVLFLSLAAFVLVGALQVLDGRLSVGGFVSFNTLVILANAPIGVLLAFWDQMQLAGVVLTRLTDVVAEEPEQGADHGSLRPVSTLEGRISARGLGFHYGGPDSPAILEDINFDVAPGTNVAIVGRSGSGKTTLIKCLAGLVPPSRGTILYDGLDMASLDHGDLRRQIGFVLQENFLFSDTIAANIAFGDPLPDQARIEWAARLANGHGFVSRLPLGYETKVGEAGLLLSGGQRQRIAIARAVYHRPPVIILDEATSALDSESERAVQSNMERLLEGQTSFVIAHRLSTIRHADVILVLEKGRLVEQGSHDELMRRQGIYSYLCNQQLAF